MVSPTGVALLRMVWTVRFHRNRAVQPETMTAAGRKHSRALRRRNRVYVAQKWPAPLALLPAPHKNDFVAERKTAMSVRRQRLSREALSISIVVRRAFVGMAPFRWEVYRAEIAASIFVSSDRFRSMEAAYTAGMARLAEFIPAHSSSPERWRGPACATINEQKEPVALPHATVCPDCWA